MKKLLLLQAAILLSGIVISEAYGQNTDYLQRAYQHIQTKYNLDQQAVGELVIKYQYRSDHNQAEHVYLGQAIQGVEIFGPEINLTFQKNGKISSVGHRLIRLDQIRVSREPAAISASEAISLASQSLGQTSRARSSQIRITEAGVPVFSKEDISLQDMPVQYGYLLTPSGEYRLVYSIQIESARRGSLYQSYVDAATGASIANDMLTLHCSFEDGYMGHEVSCHEAPAPVISSAPLTASAVGQYRILPVSIESPIHGNFELVTGAEDPQASPFGWHDTNGAAGAEFTHTRGNNVHAYLDRNWDYMPDTTVDGGVDLIFDFPYDPDTEPVMNKNVAVTNLFYWNNVMHDFTYQYGFTEIAGNYQSRNYSGQGAGGDFVNAHAQFGDDNHTTCGNDTNGGTACVNNADFSPATDGFNGRMRMFTWNRDNSSKFLDVIEPTDLAGKILTGAAQFGPMITTEPVTGEVIVINDGTFNGSKGCGPVTTQPELAGKIALIDRGLCDFSMKVYNAQVAGAIGAIICNFEDAVIGMGAGDNAALVTIPSVFISSSECSRIRIAIGNGLVAALVSPGSGGPTLRDGSLDNSIIAHEYGHGISTRITGGPNTSCLSPGATTGDAEESWGMGEGWSDFFALVTSVQPGDSGAKRRGVGTYAIKEPTNGRGIRTYPYSTDMSINPHTYDNILLESVPHGVGSVWCAMIWDLYWALSDEYGWDPDLYHGTGGNNIAIQLVMDGLKLQGCGPGFINARDAILLADTINNDAVNSCLIWNVFARRGLGANADGGLPASRSDGKQGFELPTSCRDEITFNKSMTAEVQAGDNIEVTIKMTNYKDFALTNVFIEDLIPDGCSYITGSANIPPTTGNSLVWSISSVDPDESVTITYLLKTDPAKNSIRMHFDDIEGFPEERWDIYFDPVGTTSNFWYQQDVLVHSGAGAWRVDDIATESEHFLQNFQPYTISGIYPVYRFYHYYNTETGADGGFLEISDDDGLSWIPLENHMFRNSYPRKLQYGTFAIPNLYAFSGVSSPELIMTPVYIDLRNYIGQQVKIRYRFGTDDNTAGDGWNVDDVEIMDAVLYNSEACITSDQTSPICADAPERGTIVDSQVTTSTGNPTSGTFFSLMPNPAGDLVQVVLDAEQSELASVSVFNLTGHMLSSSAWSLSAGPNQKTIDITRLPSGMYVVQLKTRDGIRSQKFVKE